MPVRAEVVSLELYRSQRHEHARLPLALEGPAFLRPGRSSPLTAEQATHRRRMLAHLETTRAGIARAESIGSGRLRRLG